MRAINKFALAAFIGVSPLLASANAQVSGVGHIPPVFQATLSGDTSELRRVLREGADPNQRSDWGMAPLHQAMYLRIEFSRILLDAGADANIRTGTTSQRPNNEWTPLFYAVALGRSDLVVALITKGAKVDLLDSSNHPALFYALKSGRSEIVQLLLDAGAKSVPEAPDPVEDIQPAYFPRGLTGSKLELPELYQAILRHDIKRVEGLLRRGANANEKVPFMGWSALHYAMESEFEICCLLLRYGADANVRVGKNERGQSNEWTPIFYAVFNDRDDLVVELLRYGAAVNVIDAMGHSPLWYAEGRNNHSVLRILEAAGAHKK